MLLPLVWLCSCASKPEQKESYKGIDPRISAPQTLEFLGETYNAGYSAYDKDKCIVEYFRAGEGQKTWKKLLSLRLNPKGMDSRQLVDKMQESVTAGGASAVRSFKGKTTDEYGIEFTMMSRKAVELDVFRFMNRPNGTGTISFQYAEKIPADELRKVGEAKLPEYYGGIRSKVVKALEEAPMPKIMLVPSIDHYK